MKRQRFGPKTLILFVLSLRGTGTLLLLWFRTRARFFNPTVLFNISQQIVNIFIISFIQFFSFSLLCIYFFSFTKSSCQICVHAKFSEFRVCERINQRIIGVQICVNTYLHSLRWLKCKVWSSKDFLKRIYAVEFGQDWTCKNFKSW